KADQSTNYPPDMHGQKGASELTRELLAAGVSPDDILKKALMVGMKRIGDRFEVGKAYIPDLLIAAKAMYAAMAHLKPYFDSGAMQHRGTMIIATVQGDLHDIGKNLVKMVMEGEGWRVIDLGTNVPAEKILQALDEHPDSIVGLSALLTTTMLNMEPITRQVKQRFGHVPVYIGGAAVSQSFCDQIGADGYFPDPQSLAQYLRKHQ
ncbi:MAG TPA: cobalamin-binding protein, partial [Caldithrix abyssi]|nr:cobalamin-binding protein [Caldithrix abyssi]